MKDKLLESVSLLKQPSSKSWKEFVLVRDRLAALGNENMANRKDLEKLVGPGNQAMAEDNNRNFSKFMESLFSAYQPEVLVETVIWVFRTYRNHGFNTLYWAANLDIWVEILKENVSEETFKEIYPFYHWLIVNIPIFVQMTDKYIETNKQ